MRYYIFLLLWLTVQALIQIKQLSVANFTSITNINPPPNDLSIKQEWFILFYAEYCSHCKVTMPIFTQLSSQKFQFDLKIGKIQCPNNPKICTAFVIQGYPTLLYFKNNKIYRFPASTVRTIENFLKFIKEAHFGLIKQLNIQSQKTLKFRFWNYLEQLTAIGIVLFVIIVGLILFLILIFSIQCIRKKMDIKEIVTDPEIDDFRAEIEKEQSPTNQN